MGQIWGYSKKKEQAYTKTTPKKKLATVVGSAKPKTGKVHLATKTKSLSTQKWWDEFLDESDRELLHKELNLSMAHPAHWDDLYLDDQKKLIDAKQREDVKGYNIQKNQKTFYNMKDSQRKAMFAKKSAQVKAIDNAIKQWNERRKDNINGKYGDPNSVEARQKFRYANSQIKSLKKERDNIKGQMVLLE